MKKVILVGDSIRIGYQPVVSQELAGKAKVWGPGQNGGNSRNVLAHLDEWVIRRSPDIVHINCGLHDLRRERGAYEHAVPVAEYEANVGRILERIRVETGAVTVWATTTPVNERQHNRAKDFDRFEADVEEYNRVATSCAQQIGASINDLYAVVMQAGRDSLLQPDGVHYGKDGYAFLGGVVAGCLLKMP